MKLLRLLVILFVAAVGAWVGRLIAHSKVPLPEGRWREIEIAELRRRP